MQMFLAYVASFLWIRADDGILLLEAIPQKKKNEPMTVPPGLGMETVNHLQLHINRL